MNDKNLQFGLMLLALTVLPVSGLLAQGTSTTLTVKSDATSYADNTTVNLTATDSTLTLTAVSFYYTADSTMPTFIGQGVPQGSGVFTFPWQNPPSGTYNVFAVPGNGTLSHIGPIDLVGTPNVAMDRMFSNAGQGVWQPGDNQMCAVDSSGNPQVPYNGKNAMYPDGTCEYTGTSTPPGYAATCSSGTCMTVNCPGTFGRCAVCPDGSECQPGAMNPYFTCPNGGTYQAATGVCSCPVGGSCQNGKCSDGSSCLALPTFTVDAMDNNMHTLTDFTVFANNLLATRSKGLATFDNWIGQAQAWLAPPTGWLLSLYLPGTSDPTGLGALTYPQGYPGIPGYPNNYMGPTIDKPLQWYKAIDQWLQTDYAVDSNTKAWCVPQESMIAGSPEDNYINGYINNYVRNNICSDHSTCGATVANQCQNGAPCVPPAWGSIHHVVACLNYNAGLDVNGNPDNTIGPVSAYGKCLSDLNRLAGSGRCSTAALPSDCSWSNPNNLGRTLNSKPMPVWNATDSTDLANRCNPAYTNKDGSPSFAKWIQNGLTLALDETPKFALRAKFLQNVVHWAVNTRDALHSEDDQLHVFLMPCGGSGCMQGGPAAALLYLGMTGLPTQVLPNSVIYGWKDNPPIGEGGCTETSSDPATGQMTTHKTGCLHLVKVTAYGPGRQVNPQSNQDPYSQRDLPTIHASILWQREWDGPIPAMFAWNVDELRNRDGDVFVSVKRWDEDHAPLSFPNSRPLWQQVFHNPKSAASPSGGFPRSCFGVGTTTGGSLGWGLTGETVNALRASNMASGDRDLLSNAFMLDDRGDGKTDPEAALNTQNYKDCLSWANARLAEGIESHACMQYVATRDASASSSPAQGPPRDCPFGTPFTCGPNPPDGQRDNEKDYTIKFFQCSYVPPDDI